MSKSSGVPTTQPRVASGGSLADQLPDEMIDTIDRDLEAGDKVGEYEVTGKLGEGGFGTVYKAVQPLIGKQVAIKVLKRQFSSNPSTLSRFIQEARAVNQIQHRYIIDIFSFGQLDDGRHYYVMSYLDGQTLQDVINRSRRLEFDAAIPILRAIAEAIDAAHRCGIAHRDLKPENVFITGDGAVKLLDFGIAKLMGTETEHKTETGAMMGTPVFMSPEQCRSADKADHRTDIYSLGVMTFQMLTGKLPFNAPNAMDIIIQHLTTTPPTPSTVCDRLPTAVDGPILHMLQKEPDSRPVSMGAAIDAVAAAARSAGIEIPHTLSALPSGIVGPKSSSMEMLPTLATADEGPGRPVAQVASTSVFLGAESQSRGSSGKSRLGWIAMAGGAAIAIAVVAFGVMGGDPASDPASDRSSASNPPATAAAATESAARTAPEQAGAAAPAPVAEPEPIAPTAPATVTIDVQGTPGGTRVLGPDGEELGTAPGAIELARDDEPVALTFELTGYKSKTRTITPSANAFLEIAMDRDRRARTTRKKSSSDRKAKTSSESGKTADGKATDSTPRKKPDSKPAKKKSADDIENPF